MSVPLFDPAEDDPRRGFALHVVQQLRNAGYQALWAGGCVRDALMGEPPKDFDVATTAAPDDVIRLFGRRRTIPVGASFGVVIVQGPRRESGQVEVATFRSDGPYSDGRRPDSVEYCTPEEDAARRDFTINGMFYDPVQEELVDFVGGEADLHRRIIRAIGDPDARFDEDKLRMLRAVRFSATLGFDLDPATERSISRWHSSLSVVSVERINAELHRMLAHPNRADAVDLLKRTRLLEVIFPPPPNPPHPNPFDDPATWQRLRDSLRALARHRFEPALLLLLRTRGFTATDCDQGWLRRESSRLKLANVERDRLCWLHLSLPLMDHIAERPMHVIKPLLAHPDHELLFDLAWAAATAEGRSSDDVAFCRDFRQRYSAEDLDPPPLLSGHDIMQAGVPAGPQISGILKRIREEQLDERLRDREAALQRVRQFVASEDV